MTTPQERAIAERAEDEQKFAFEPRYVMHLTPEESARLSDNAAKRRGLEAHAKEAERRQFRDAVALAALPEIVSLIGIPTEEPDELWNAAIAAQAYALADAMLKARG